MSLLHSLNKLLTASSIGLSSCRVLNSSFDAKPLDASSRLLAVTPAVNRLATIILGSKWADHTPKLNPRTTSTYSSLHDRTTYLRLNDPISDEWSSRKFLSYSACRLSSLQRLQVTWTACSVSMPDVLVGPTQVSTPSLGKQRIPGQKTRSTPSLGHHESVSRPGHPHI